MTDVAEEEIVASDDLATSNYDDHEDESYMSDSDCVPATHASQSYMSDVDCVATSHASQRYMSDSDCVTTPRTNQSYVANSDCVTAPRTNQSCMSDMSYITAPRDDNNIERCRRFCDDIDRRMAFSVFDRRLSMSEPLSLVIQKPAVEVPSTERSVSDLNGRTSVAGDDGDEQP